MKIAIHTLGCKVNQYESEALGLALSQKGYDVCFDFEPADVFIVNTCAVTNEAEKKSRQTLSKFKKLNSKGKIIVCGCASEKSQEAFLKNKNVVFVSGVANKLKILDYIEKEDRAGAEIDPLPLEYNETYRAAPSKTRAYVKVQDGCNNFCSYCIIPYLRGRSRSRNVVEILNEIESLEKSVNEVVLTGIDLSDFKIDGEKALPKLLEMLSGFDLRIRLGSLEQGVIDEEFLKLGAQRNLCPHFHLSLQSGSESVLKRMNRHYTPEEFYSKVERLRKAFDNPAITTDIIVGFPGETEQEFLETVEFIKRVGFSSLHVFPYSKREGTVAARMKDLDGETKKRRVLILEKLNSTLQEKYINQSKKNILSVLIEEKIGKYYVGHSENYIKCYIKSKKLEPNSFVNVKIKKKFADGALAKIVKKER